MRRNQNGRGSGFTLVVLLIVAIIVAYLAATQMGSLGIGKTDTQQEQTQQNAVDMAQDAVNAINERMQQTGEEP